MRDISYLNLLFKRNFLIKNKLQSLFKHRTSINQSSTMLQCENINSKYNCETYKYSRAVSIPITVLNNKARRPQLRRLKARLPQLITLNGRGMVECAQAWNRVGWQVIIGYKQVRDESMTAYCIYKLDQEELNFILCFWSQSPLGDNFELAWHLA